MYAFGTCIAHMIAIVTYCVSTWNIRQYAVVISTTRAFATHHPGCDVANWTVNYILEFFAGKTHTAQNVFALLECVCNRYQLLARGAC